MVFHSSSGRSYSQEEYILLESTHESKRDFGNRNRDSGSRGEGAHPLGEGASLGGREAASLGGCETASQR